MGGMLDSISDFLGLPYDVFDMAVLAALGILLLFVLIQSISLKRRGAGSTQLQLKVKDLEDELEDSVKRVKTGENERLRLVKQHEEALSKLKEAKESILKSQGEFESYKKGFQNDISKVTAMEEELKILRIKLGELNKEKESISATYEKEKESLLKDQAKAVEKLEKELALEKKKTSSIQQEFEDELKKTERLHERRIDEIKTQAKDAMIKLTKEKDAEMEDLKIENEKQKKQIDKLKDDLRVLQIENL